MVPELTLTKPESDIAPSAHSWLPPQGEWTDEDYTRLPDLQLAISEICPKQE